LRCFRPHHLLENLKLDELAAKKVYEFAFVMQPLKMKGFSGSAVGCLKHATSHRGTSHHHAARALTRRLHLRARVMASSTLARTLVRLRPSFTVALVGLVVLITAATAVAIGGLAWREQRARSRAIVDAAMAQTAAGRVPHPAVSPRGGIDRASRSSARGAGAAESSRRRRRGALRPRRAAVESAADLGQLRRPR
jgi:hypothetical protein